MDFFCENDIFKFNISVHNMHAVEIIQAIQQLFEDHFDYDLIETLAGFDEIDDRTPLTKLCNY